MSIYSNQVESLIKDFPWLWYLLSVERNGWFNPTDLDIRVRNLHTKNWEVSDFCQNYLYNVQLGPDRYWLHCIDRRIPENPGEILIKIDTPRFQAVVPPFATQVIAGIRQHLKLPTTYDVSDPPIPPELQIAHFCILFSARPSRGAELHIYRMKDSETDKQIPFNKIIESMLQQ